MRAVWEFHAFERPPAFSHSPYPGVCASRLFLPLDSVGVYVPGGLHPLPSSLIMSCVPALAAGVPRIVVATPKPDPIILASCRLLGINEIYCIGGAQAIAALAYGTETVRRVDKIVGPGQIWTQAAKLLVSGVVGIDFVAGPSEILIIADESADPVCVAADLLAQIEHGPGSEALLVTTSHALVDRVTGLVGESEQIRIEQVESLEAALARANEYAPKHLELMVTDPEAVLMGVRNAGAVFLGLYAPAAAGDYAVGTNHILPTGGLARSYGALGLEAFLKPIEIVRVDRQGLEAMASTATRLARVEGLEQHARSIEARFDKDKP